MKKYIILIILSLGCWVGIHAQTPQKMAYVYDALNRLTAVTYPNGSKITYNYDVLGNRLNVVSTPNCTIPAAPTLSAIPTTVSIGVSSILSATGCPGGTITWSNSLGTGTTKTVSPIVTAIYTATCTGNCESSNGSVTVTFTNCPNSLTHSGTVAAHPYKAALSITSTGNTANGTGYEAGKSIFLNPGFSAGGNETFTAKIAGCN